MYTPRPILWYNPDRISPEDIDRLAQEIEGGVLIPAVGNSPHPPCGFIRERWPTPDELFRWKPREKTVIEEFVEMQRLLEDANQ